MMGSEGSIPGTEREESWAVRCNDCGFEKIFRDEGTGISPEKSAKRSKAGHIGGQSQYFSLDDSCEEVIVEPLVSINRMIDEERIVPDQSSLRTGTGQ